MNPYTSQIARSASAKFIVTRSIIESLGAKFRKFNNNEVIVQTKKIQDISFSSSLGLDKQDWSTDSRSAYC